MNSPEVIQTAKELKVVMLKADYTRGDPEITRLLQQLGNHAGSIPFYAVFPARNPTRPIVFGGLITAQQVVEALRAAGPSQPKPEVAHSLRSPAR